MNAHVYDIVFLVCFLPGACAFIPGTHIGVTNTPSAFRLPVTQDTATATLNDLAPQTSPADAAVPPPPEQQAAAVTAAYTAVKVKGVQSIENYEDFDRMLASQDGVVVIKFYASFCRACKSMSPKFRQLASQHQDDAIPMTFAEMELLANKGLCKELGVKRVPSVHFYHKGKKVEDFVCGPKKIPILKERLDDYSTNGITAAMTHSELLHPHELADTTDISDVYGEENESAATRKQAIV